MTIPRVPTPGQTVGPFFHRGLTWASSGSRADDVALGAIVVEGTVEDGLGDPLPAWLVEAWVPHAAAGEAAAGFATPGVRRLVSDERGQFEFRVPRPEAGQPVAFITVCGVGLTRHHFTAVFLETAAGVPSILDDVPGERRSTLVAERIADGRYRWIIRTQGERETVFFDYR
jgi:protocatechuate 3,4-dioxygenase alpha subunit